MNALMGTLNNNSKNVRRAAALRSPGKIIYNQHIDALAQFIKLFVFTPYNQPIPVAPY